MEQDVLLNDHSLDELVLHGNNGLVFRTADELALHLTVRSYAFPSNALKFMYFYKSTLVSFPMSPRLSTLRAFFSSKFDWDWCSWNENWDRVLRPIVTHEVTSGDTLLEENYRRYPK